LAVAVITAAGAAVVNGRIFGEPREHLVDRRGNLVMVSSFDTPILKRRPHAWITTLPLSVAGPRRSA
jgi:hypothetical protein